MIWPISFCDIFANLFLFSLIVLFLHIFTIVFAKYEHVDAQEANDHADDLERIGPLVVNQADYYGRPCAFLVVDGLDWARFSQF